MRVRKALPHDLPVIAQLIRGLAEYEHLSHEVCWTEERLGQTLLGPQAVPETALVELDDPPGTVAGFAVWFPTYSTFAGEAGIWLEDLFVLPRYRGRGAGTALLKHVFEQAGNGRVEWAVLDWNSPSIAFYTSLGARPVDGWRRFRWTRSASQ